MASRHANIVIQFLFAWQPFLFYEKFTKAKRKSDSFFFLRGVECRRNQKRKGANKDEKNTHYDVGMRADARMRNRIYRLRH